MRFRPCIDFFRKGYKLLLTGNGKKKLEQIKITGTKISYFFKLKLNLPDEEEQITPKLLDKEEITEYQVGSKLFNFPFMPKRNPKKQEKYREVEEKIKEYIEKETGKTGINYPIDKYDIFDEDEYFGGVPDGEERDIDGNTISILEIKTVTDIRNKQSIKHRFQSPPLNYQLQIALYLFLRGLDTGYICICFLNPDNGQDINTIKLNTHLKNYSQREQTLSGTIDSGIKEIGSCDYEYTILESYCNDFLNDNEILLFKIKINMDKYKRLIYKIKDWFIKNKNASPALLEDELKKILSKNKNG